MTLNISSFWPRKAPDVRLGKECRASEKMDINGPSRSTTISPRARPCSTIASLSSDETKVKTTTAFPSQAATRHDL